MGGVPGGGETGRNPSDLDGFFHFRPPLRPQKRLEGTEQGGFLVVRPVVLLKEGADGLEHGRVQILEHGQGIAPAGKGGGQTGQSRPTTTAGGNRRLGAWRSRVPGAWVGLTGQRVGQRHDLPHRLR